MLLPGDTLSPPPLSAETYTDPQKVAAMQLVLDTYGLDAPTIVYPGSSADASLTQLRNARVIHLDPALTADEVHALDNLPNSQAYPADAHTWRPADGTSIDVIAFFRPSGIRLDTVLDGLAQTPGQLVTWADGGSMRPRELQSRPDLELVGAVRPTGDTPPQLETEHLEDYFTRKTYEELTEEEREAFHETVEAIIKPLAESSWAEVYDLLQHPRHANFVFENQICFPYRQDGPALFVYRRVNP